MYGVVVEYLQYAVEGQPEFAEWPFFAIESRLRACDSFVFRLPIRETEADANIAGIAGFAIRPIVTDLLPIPEPPTILPIYDPFILGDNSNYEVQETCYGNIISDIEVVRRYLCGGDAFPAKALKHTGVITLSGTIEFCAELWDESLEKQVKNPSAPIDMYFYSDYKIVRYVDATLAIPLICVSELPRPSRIVFGDGCLFLSIDDGGNHFMRSIIRRR